MTYPEKKRDTLLGAVALLSVMLFQLAAVVIPLALAIWLALSLYHCSRG